MYMYKLVISEFKGVLQNIIFMQKFLKGLEKEG